jgi:hypothetical protein
VREPQPAGRCGVTRRIDPVVLFVTLVGVAADLGFAYWNAELYSDHQHGRGGCLVVAIWCTVLGALLINNMIMEAGRR